jgi:hypothetical protein
MDTSERRNKLISIDGFDELHRNLDKLQKNIESLSGEHEVSFTELFPPGFMARYTNFTSFDDLLAKCGFKVNTVEDFANIPEVAWDTFIASSTRFASWDEMKQKALEEYLQRKMGI